MTDANRDQAVAFFITPHGFGHAARACAVMSAMLAQDASLHFHIFTTVPVWFFEESLEPETRANFTHHELECDVGLAQSTSLHEDLGETLERLMRFLPFDPALVSDLAAELRRLRCRLVLCDIAPLGIAVAQKAGIPSILIENFTWDWIYAGHGEQTPLQPYRDYLAMWFAVADYRIQAEPVCQPAAADLRTHPISRASRRSAQSVRNELGLPFGTALVLISMGGVAWDYTFLPQLKRCENMWFILPGGDEPARQEDNLLIWPYRSGWYHPDIVQACDAVVAKLGYSTVAEAYQAGVPLGYVTRPHFRESPVLQAWVERNMSAQGIDGNHFGDGGWIERLPELLALPRRATSLDTGASQAAKFILSL
ncbi:MAG: hypothetical protein J5I90_04450 [Caldilineales bacterium]|nr:hypothetical protein [Caldilineales bacterium]